MKNPIRSFFCQEKNRPDPIQYQMADLSGFEPKSIEVAPPNGPNFMACAGCGGAFQPDRLKSSWEITLRFHDRAEDGVREPTVALMRYCTACCPPAPVTFVLADSGRDYLDQRAFKVEDGWFQDVNEETGEDRYTISLEEWQRAFCSECGVETEPKTCRVCHPPKKSKSSK